MRLPKFRIAVLVVSAIVATFTYATSPQPTEVGQCEDISNVHCGPIFEDGDRWDCSAMGNLICGRTP